MKQHPCQQTARTRLSGTEKLSKAHSLGLSWVRLEAARANQDTRCLTMCLTTHYRPTSVDTRPDSPDSRQLRNPMVSDACQVRQWLRARRQDRPCSARKTTTTITSRGTFKSQFAMCKSLCISHWYRICLVFPSIMSRAVCVPKTGVDRSATPGAAIPVKYPTGQIGQAHTASPGLVRNCGPPPKHQDPSYTGAFHPWSA